MMGYGDGAFITYMGGAFITYMGGAFRLRLVDMYSLDRGVVMAALCHLRGSLTVTL